MKKFAVSIAAAMLVSLLSSSVGSASYNFTPLIYPGARMTGAYGNNDLGYTKLLFMKEYQGDTLQI
jgi:hypothetical protein